MVIGTVLNTQKMSLLSRRELLDSAARITALAAWPGCAAAEVLRKTLEHLGLTEAPGAVSRQP
jgi:hypothetical protein